MNDIREFLDQSEIMKRVRRISDDTSNDNGKDRISALPNDVLCSIVDLLSIRDAIHTSTLSRRWKNIYAHKSTLEFDWRDIISNDANTYTRGNVAIRNVRNFQRSIEAILASYLGTKLESFKVQCCFGNEHPRYFKGWINFAIAKGVRNLELAFSCDELSERTDWIAIDYYNFPTHLLPSGEGSNLRHVSLRTCKLRLDNIFTDRFSTLTSLVLCDAKFVGRVEPSMFSSCSKLESLTLERCYGFESLHFDNLDCLKMLVVKRCEGLRLIRLISVINLTTFHCIGDHAELQLRLGRVPNLKDVHLMLKRINVRSFYAWLEKLINPHYHTLIVAKCG
ncbi:putative F-box protein At1g49610 [Prunus dulcis]|nr:putative F-box protein At1g49610 [Prunus dulcis]